MLSNQSGSAAPTLENVIVRVMEYLNDPQRAKKLLADTKKLADLREETEALLGKKATGESIAKLEASAQAKHDEAERRLAGVSAEAQSITAAARTEAANILSAAKADAQRSLAEGEAERAALAELRTEIEAQLEAVTAASSNLKMAKVSVG